MNLKRLHCDESAQAMVFGALTLFCLVSFVAAAFDVGEVSANRIQMQNAADQAALAGAQVEADLLSEIGWINDGMAYIYYNTMRYAVDVTTYGVLAELKRHGPPYPDDSVVGVDDPVGKYEQAYAKGQEWITRGQNWIQHLQKLEAGMAIAAPSLIRQEIFRVALAHGAQKVAIFPELVFYPDPESYLLLNITRLGNGWTITDNNGYQVQVTVLGSDSYQVTSSKGGSFTVTRDNPNHYTIVSSEGATTLTRTNLGWIISGPNGSFQVADGPNGGYQINGGEYRRGPDGTLQQFQNGQWIEMSNQKTLNIDGTDVPITQSSIKVGEATVDLNPLRIGIDNLSITPAGNNVIIEGSIGPAWLRVQDDYAVVNGLSTRTADGKWRTWGGDLTRHRMTRTGADAWNYELKKEGSVLQVETNRERFGVIHAVRENDPAKGKPYPAWMADPSNPNGWFDPRTGTTTNPMAYHQTRPCWHPDDNFCPRHGQACPGNGGAYEDRAHDGGWHDFATGRWVDCPICQGIDNDGDGKTDVRKFQSDTFPRHDPTFQNVALPLPYVLADTFFRFGINVGVWRDKAAPLLNFPDPAWGTFAFASAKAGFLDPDTGLFTYGMADLTARKDWIDNDATNLYQPEWEARLVSTRTAIRTDDLDADAAIDSGANFLLRGFLSTRWLETADDRNPVWFNGKLGAMLSKEGRAFDVLDKQYEQVVKH